MQQVYEADDDWGGWGRGMPETLHCQFMHVFVCALKLLQNGRRNGGKIAAK